LHQLIEKILGEMAKRGVMSFARFMELALYCPVYGFYEKEEDTLGRTGDFYTSVCVGPLFGQLLALQFAEWLTQLGVVSDPGDGHDHVAEGSPAGLSAKLGTRGGFANLRLVEAGAHRGELARDILSWLKAHRPEIYTGLQYWIVEPSAQRTAWQRGALREFSPQVYWARSLAECDSSRLDSGPTDSTRPSVRGIIFSNELLDAMPVHRLGWDASRHSWFEWGVTFSEGRFQWTRCDQLSACCLEEPEQAPWKSAVQRLPSQLLSALPEGFILEVCPVADKWWADAAQLLEAGKLLTIDYGLTEEEILTPARCHGTLRAYSRHHASSEILASPGDRDLTAHINFSALHRIGEAAGLNTDMFLSQERFLTQIAAPLISGQTSFGKWSAEQIRQFQTLTHPNHLGGSFRVLVQSRTGSK
jgi:SAM-dependent MidA family methyltransferase